MRLFKYLSSIVSQTLSRFANAAIKASKDDRLSVYFFCKTVSGGESFFNLKKMGLTVHLDPYIDHIFRWMGCTVGLKISCARRRSGLTLEVFYSLPVSTEFNLGTKENVSVVLKKKKKNI